jgi:hypothetical protein
MELLMAEKRVNAAIEFSVLRSVCVYSLRQHANRASPLEVYGGHCLEIWRSLGVGTALHVYRRFQVNNTCVPSAAQLALEVWG